MTRRLAPLLLLLALLAPLAAAQAPPVDFEPVGPVEAAHWVARPGAPDEANVTFAPGESGVFHVVVRSSGNATYEVYLGDLEGPFLAEATPEPVLVNETTGAAAWNFTFQVPSEAEDRVFLSFSLTVMQGEGANRTQAARETFGFSVPVVPPEAPFPIPPVLLLAGLAVLLVLAFALLRSRRRQVRAPPRSRTLAELDVERRAERGSPRAAAEIEQRRAEVEARERERLAEREQRIIEAKRQDILRSIELARARLERGEITEFQFRKLKEKKDQQLAEFDARHGT